MVEHLHSTILFAGDTVSIRDVRCRPCGVDRHEEEISVSDDIVFPRSGAFVHHREGREVFADSNSVLFFTRHQSYYITHPNQGGDDCTVLRFRRSVLRDAISEIDPAVSDRATALFPQPDAPTDHCTFVAMQRLRALLRDGEPCGVRVEELAMRVLAAAMDSLVRFCNRPTRRARPATARAHRRTIIGARAFLAASFRERLTLSGIARAVHSSPFHLARMFARETGSTIHQFLLDLRLRSAVERLADGTEDLTRLALDLGFSSHGHFSDSFRRAFGISPSGIRKDISGDRFREMSKNLEVT